MNVRNLQLCAVQKLIEAEQSRNSVLKVILLKAISIFFCLLKATLSDTTHDQITCFKNHKFL